jgi:hypothetical protein
MTELPVIQDCALDERQLADQVQRYRKLAQHVTEIDRSAGRVEVQLDAAVPTDLIARTIEIERGCCPFYELDYDAAPRRLTITVGDTALDGRLDPLVAALTAPAQPAP